MTDGARRADRAPRSKPASLFRVAVRNAGSVVFLRLSGILVGILLTPIVLRSLGLELYGLAVIAGSVYEYMSLMRGGMNAALRRYVTLSHQGGKASDARRFYAVGFWWSGLLRVVMLALGFALAVPICRFVRLPEELLAQGAIGVALIVAASVVADLAGVFEVPTYATGRTASLSVIRALGTWGRLGLMLLGFALVAPTLPVYGATLVLVELLPVLGLIWFAWRSGVVGSPFPRLSFGDRDTRRLLFSYGGLALIGQLAALLYTSADNLFIGRFFGPDDVTRYSLGTRWAPLVGGFLLSSIQSLTPLFTGLEAKGESERARGAMMRVVALTSALAVPACLVPCVVGDLFLARWVGEEYRGSALYLIAMMAPLTIEIALAPIWMGLLAKGRIAWLATADIVVAVGNVCLSLFLGLGLGMGLLGFALGNTAALLAKHLLLRPILARRDPGMPGLLRCLRPLPFALLGGAPGLLLLWFLRPVYETSLISVVLAGGLGGALSLAGSTALAVGPKGIRELWERVRGGTSRRTTPNTQDPGRD